MELNRVYFFTATIKNWYPLLEREGFMKILIDSLRYLATKNQLNFYGFVFMPNHIHLIIENIDLNGKEMPHASFLKFTSHKFLLALRANQSEILNHFKVDEANKSHSFWQRDSLAIELFTPSVAYQKLSYIHNNPCRGKWMLVEDPILYPYSSFEFYEYGNDRFGFLTHIGERL
ncbi:transposase [Algoriphagus kandeliae]|uniref:Transposase n=1 Tax=Algoriphagus kandeliae TaxID=2562278 RepID=A0A4Y9QRM4_9BACT|nr:transposase [Algoriphagus kandeliae]TFV94458.1 transposase [Algoriphagus kandeliae]